MTEGAEKRGPGTVESTSTETTKAWVSAEVVKASEFAVKYKYPEVKLGSFPELEKLGHTCMGMVERAPKPNEGNVSTFGQRPTRPVGPALTGVAREVYDCLLTCLPVTTRTWSDSEIGWAAPCVNTQLGQISLVVPPEELYPAMDAYSYDYPESADTCHESGHASPRITVIGQKRRIAELVDTIPREACGAGFLHGLMDAMPYDDPSPETIELLSKKCIEYTPKNPSSCAHGMGHAAWDVYKNQYDAVKYGCAYFMEAYFVDCASAIEMRRAEHSFPEDLDQAIADVTTACSKWPDETLPDGSSWVLGCWGGITNELWWRFARAGEIDDMTEAEIRDHVERSTEVCNLFPSVKSPYYPNMDKVNYCDVLTGKWIAIAVRLDLERGRELCLYSKADVDLCLHELKNYIDTPQLERGQVTTPIG